jgi:hypothetical protein
MAELMVHRVENINVEVRDTDTGDRQYQTISITLTGDGMKTEVTVFSKNEKAIITFGEPE